MKLKGLLFSAGSFVLLFSLIVFSGCTKSEAPSSNATPTTEPVASTTAAPAVSPEESATVVGKVNFQGSAPAMKTVSMSKEQSCAKAHSAKPQKEETVVVNSNKTLRYVVVYVKSGLTGTNFASPPAVTLDQKTCWYNPHVLAVMTGQTINVINSDSGVLHNIHFMPKMNTPLNFGQPGPPPGGPPATRPISFAKPEFIPVKCDVHSWMHAFVAVISNPYFGVTDEKGTFEISGLPPGTYTLEAWHEKYGTRDIQVTGKKKEKKTVRFTFKS